MAWTIPDKGEGVNDLQSVLFQEYLDALVAGINGVDCVLSGLVVTGAASMTPSVAKGAVLSNGTLFAIAANTVTIGTSDPTNPRLDLIVVTSAGALAVRAGTASATPKPPAKTANDVVVAVVYVPAAATTIPTANITDMRVLRTQGPIVLKKTTTPVVINTNATIQTYFTITLPSGLFLAGKILRIQCGGTMLLNSGTPTVTLTIAYGGTTMFADVSVAATADVDRLAWFLDLYLTAQANNDQALVGNVEYSPIAAKTAPTTGVGDIALTASSGSPISGAAAVDSDAGDRTFTVQWTMNVSNVSDEIAMEFGVAELL